MNKQDNQNITTSQERQQNIFDNQSAQTGGKNQPAQNNQNQQDQNTQNQQGSHNNKQAANNGAQNGQQNAGNNQAVQNGGNNQQNQNQQANPELVEKTPIPPSIPEIQKQLEQIFHNCADVVIQQFPTKKEPALIVYIDGIVNKDMINRDVIAPLKARDFDGNIDSAIRTHFDIFTDIDNAVREVLTGNTAIFYGKSKQVRIVDMKKWDRRAVDVPDSETVLRGPKEGFVESLATNIALVRKKIRSANLKIETIFVGKQSDTAVALVYMNGIVNRQVLEEIKKRISNIDISAILASGYIEELIEEQPLSPISGIGLTQKPDKVASKILEGRVVVFVDGSPQALVIPELFIENIHTAEDYYVRPVYATALRLLRTVGLFLTVMLPGFSVAIATFNPEMMPSEFLTNIITHTQGTPMPIAFEVFVMILMFELLEEAGTRLPKTIGSAITIVGSLIIGESAVNAGIVGAPTVIIVGLTAVTSFIVPNLKEFVLIYRLLFLVLGASMGIVGLGAGLVIMLTQLCSQNSFGVPIMALSTMEEMKDTLVRFPLNKMIYRPQTIAKDNVKKAGGHNANKVQSK